ncbi:Uncharacterised protein, partial [Mycoplasmopsis synoviae]
MAKYGFVSGTENCSKDATPVSPDGMVSLLERKTW